MKVYNSIILYVVLLGMLVGLSVYACSNSVRPFSDSEVDPEEAIELSLENLLGFLEDFRSGDFTVRTIAFLGASSGEYFSADWVERLIEQLDDEHIQHDAISASKRFSLNQHRGIYTWNVNTERWAKSPHPNAAILRFPSSRTQSTNNMEIQIGSYTDTPVLIDGVIHFLPFSGTIRLLHSNNEIFSFDFSNVSYVSHQDVFLPASGNLSIAMNNFVHDLTISQNNSRHFRLEHSMQTDGKLAFGFDINLNLRHSAYADLSEDDLIRLYGDVKITDLVRVEADIALGELLIRGELRENDINNFVNLNVFSGSQKIGELRYSDALENFRVIFPDGTARDIYFFSDWFLDRLEAITFVFTGPWDDF